MCGLEEQYCNTWKICVRRIQVMMDGVNRRNRHKTKMTFRIKKKCNLADSLENEDSKGKGQEKHCVDVGRGKKLGPKGR